MTKTLIQILSSLWYEILIIPRMLGAGILWLSFAGKWSYEYYFEEYIQAAIALGAAMLLLLLAMLIML